MMKVLVTGASGYIGSHTCVELLNSGHDVTGFDNLSNSSEKSIERIQEITGKRMRFLNIDLLDQTSLQKLFASQTFDAVIHFAGLKSVGESVGNPLRYYRNNVTGSVNLLTAMQGASCKRLVFSSSCTVYGEVKPSPVNETHPRVSLNPYGRTKLQIEDICMDLTRSDPGWRIALLRYFNPVGAHESGRIGEDPRGVPNNLMPFVMQSAVGRRGPVRVFGNDYPTPDGTGIRDYIHVVDLAIGHVAALQKLDLLDPCQAINLGTGRGSSVLEVIASASQVVGRNIPYEIAPRRPGDTAAIWADPSLAKKLLGWSAGRTLDQMCEDHWRWQKNNQTGYDEI